MTTLSNQGAALIEILQPTPFASLPEPEPGWFDVSYAITGDGLLASLRSTCDVAGNWYRNVKAKETARPLVTRNAMARLSIFDGITEYGTIEFPLETAFPVFDTHRNGGWIVASARCRPTDVNATLFSDEGQAIDRFCLGDGMEHLQCDDRGNIWVGYFDEGVFGNDGWKLPGSKAPISMAGLVQFDPSGKVLWQLDDPSMADCYALNVTRSTTWAYYYTDFPIVEIATATGRTRVRQTTVTGGHSLACDAQGAMIIGGYSPDRDGITLLDFRDGVQTVARFRHALPSTFSERAALCQARGDTLHIVQDRLWNQLTLNDVRLAAAQRMSEKGRY